MGTESRTDYSTNTVVSADGTVIGYRELGAGPAVVLLHGGMQAAQNLMSLGRNLGRHYRVIIPDRRGRGVSGPAQWRIPAERAVEDVQALIEASGATRLFGLSAGALIALRTALVTPSLTKVALYEPPLPIRGSFPTGWIPRFEREVQSGDLTAALITNLKGLGTEPVFGRIPRFVLSPLLRIGARFQSTPEGDIPLLDLVPTQAADLALIAQLADTTEEYRAVGADVLLLRGSRSPAYFETAVAELDRVIPNSRLTTLAGLGHSGPDDDGKPDVVAAELDAFFA